MAITSRPSSTSSAPGKLAVPWEELAESWDQTEALFPVHGPTAQSQAPALCVPVPGQHQGWGLREPALLRIFSARAAEIAFSNRMFWNADFAVVFQINLTPRPSHPPRFLWKRIWGGEAESGPDKIC